MLATTGSKSSIPKIPLLKWHRQTSRSFKDMTSDGVANIVSEAVLDNELEAPLATEVSSDQAQAVHRMFVMYVQYAVSQRKLWSRLSLKEKKEQGLVFDNRRTGYLHQLVHHGLVLPSGYTIEISGSTRGSFNEQGKAASIELVVTLVEQDDPSLLDIPKKRGRPVRSENMIVYRLARVFYKGNVTYQLSVKGSGLFLLQGNTDYALPNRMRPNKSVDNKPADMPTELFLFLSTMRAPFQFLQNLATVAVTMGLGTTEQRKAVAAVPKLIRGLSNTDLQIRGFTFTRYIDFTRLFGQDEVNTIPNSRQLFLKSLFLIYDVAKANRLGFVNNGLKTYKGIKAETTFEHEYLQRFKDLGEDDEADQRSKAGLPHTPDDKAPGSDKSWVKHLGSAGSLYSVRLTKIDGRQASRSTNIATSIYFSMPKVVDRGKLGLSASGADYLQKNCLRVRFTVYSHFLRKNRIASLQDLIDYLCPDKELTTFRSNLDKLFLRVLHGYDYFYWSGLRWQNVARKSARDAFLERLDQDETIPAKVKRVLNIWLGVDPASDPDLTSLFNIVTRVYTPDSWINIKDGRPLDKEVEHDLQAKTRKLRDLVLETFGVDMNYPLAFHITVLEAFRNSTLHALYYSGDPESQEYNKARKLEYSSLKRVSVAAVQHLANKQVWHALPMTMRKRQLVTEI